MVRNRLHRAMHGNIATLGPALQGDASREAGKFKMLSWNCAKMAASGESGTAAEKLGWLGSALEDTRPALVALLEVCGGREEMTMLRKWAGCRQYDMVWMVGAEGAGSGALNGIVWM